MIERIERTCAALYTVLAGVTELENVGEGAVFAHGAYAEAAEGLPGLEVRAGGVNGGELVARRERKRISGSLLGLGKSSADRRGRVAWKRNEGGRGREEKQERREQGRGGNREERLT